LRFKRHLLAINRRMRAVCVLQTARIRLFAFTATRIGACAVKRVRRGGAHSGTCSYGGCDCRGADNGPGANDGARANPGA
jgi:hypothetical protein